MSYIITYVIDYVLNHHLNQDAYLYDLDSFEVLRQLDI